MARVENKQDILQLLQTHRQELQALGVSRLGLFGSFASGRQESKSDIDFLVEFEPSAKTYRNFISLAYLLEDLVGRRVELVTPEGLSPYIGPHILESVEYVKVA